MTISEDLIDRLSTETGRRLSSHARSRRRSALTRITRYSYVTTEDGKTTKELTFERPPTLAELVERVGDRAFVVSVAIKRQSLREMFRTAIAAE
jgi:hypothetical protein